MKKEERLNLLKLSKPKYVLYWHFIKGYNNPYTQGYIGIAEVTKYANRWNGDFKSNYKGCSHFYNVIYNSQVEAEQFTGISHKLISASCCNEKRCAGGYHWRIV